jgi:ribosome-associated protein
MEMIKITSRLCLPDNLLDSRFIRASGPGGQNVNKVETAVQLRFDAANCADLDEAQKARLMRLAGARATGDGAIVIRAQRYRTQEANRRDAEARLAALVRRALSPPKARRPTRVSKAQKAKRLNEKSKRGERKRLRRQPRGEEG